MFKSSVKTKSQSLCTLLLLFILPTLEVLQFDESLYGIGGYEAPYRRCAAFPDVSAVSRQEDLRQHGRAHKPAL